MNCLKGRQCIQNKETDKLMGYFVSVELMVYNAKKEFHKVLCQHRNYVVLSLAEKKARKKNYTKRVSAEILKFKITFAFKGVLV